MKKSNGEVRKINRLTEQYRNPDGTLHCPFCGQNKRLKGFSQWFPMYHNQEQFKAGVHKKYEGEIKLLQQEIRETNEDRNAAIQDKYDAERDIRLWKQRCARAHNEAYREICEFLKHYDLKLKEE